MVGAASQNRTAFSGFQTSVITRPTQAATVAVPERIELSRSARQADIMATRSWNQLVQAVGTDPTNSSESRFYRTVPYPHGGACKMESSERLKLSIRGSKSAAFAVLATPARLNFAKNFPESRQRVAMGQNKTRSFERAGVPSDHSLVKVDPKHADSHSGYRVRRDTGANWRT